MNRRSFLQKSSLAAAGTLMVPMFLKGLDGRRRLAGNGRNLVVVQLSGGNDGLNTVVPFRNDAYFRLRPNLHLNASALHPLNEELALHQAMPELKKIFDEGHMAVLNAVGYPNPDRSHFRSMDIWHTASDANEYLSTGWLGRYLDSDCAGCDSPHHAIEVDDVVSLALKGNTRSGFAASDPKRLNRGLQNPVLQNIIQNHHGHDHDENVAYLYKTLLNTAASANYLGEKMKPGNRTLPAPYPNSFFAKDLKQVADLISSGCDAQVYYVTLGGFDTHANQQARQEKLLQQLSQGMGAFIGDLKANNHLADTTVLVFSEFGRRVAENGSRGTDHGAANNVLLFGGALKQTGVLNAAPDLLNLDNGDVAWQVDFRSIYATLLRNWLGADDAAILGEGVPVLGFL